MTLFDLGFEHLSCLQLWTTWKFQTLYHLFWIFLFCIVVLSHCQKYKISKMFATVLSVFMLLFCSHASPAGSIWCSITCYIGTNSYTRNEIARYFRLRKHDLLISETRDLSPRDLFRSHVLYFYSMSAICRHAIYRHIRHVIGSTFENIFLFNYFYLII